MTKKKKKQTVGFTVPQPSPALLVKLGSIVRHAEELISPVGHAFDRLELEQRLQDPELVEWLREMDALAFLPVLRNRG